MPTMEELMSNPSTPEKEAEIAEAQRQSALADAENAGEVVETETTAEEEMPTEEEAPKEEIAEDDKTIDLDAFEGAEKQEIKEAEADKEKQKTEEAAAIRQAEADKVTAKNLDGLVDEEQRFAKQMSNEAWEYFRPAIVKAKENAVLQEQVKTLNTKLAEKGVPESYLDHPLSYTLDPEYTKIATLAQQNAQLKEYWKSQLKSVKAGEKWKDLTQDAQGNVIQVDKDATDDAEEYLRERVHGASTAIAQASAQVSQLQAQFSSRVQQRIAALKQVEDQFFPSYADPEVAKKDPNYTDAYNELTSRGLASNPLLGMVTKSYATIKKLQIENAELKKGQARKQTIAQQAAKAGPAKTETAKGGGKVNPLDQPIDFSKFEP